MSNTAAGLKLLIASQLEQSLPPAALAVIAWPYIACLALGRLFGSHGRQWRAAVADMRAGRPGVFDTWRHLVDESYLTMASFWPSRFLEPRWRRRITLQGFEPLVELYASQTPIVIAVMHFTHMSMLRFVLRSYGIPAASLAGFRMVHPTMEARNAALDEKAGLTGIPNRFLTAELRSAYDFLRSGKCLIIACDVESPKYVAIDTDLGVLHMATGPFRLAQMANARVVPAILWQHRRWRFSVAFGEPMAVPADASTPEALRPIAERCMEHWLPVMRRYPTQYDGGLGRVWHQTGKITGRSQTPRLFPVQRASEPNGSVTRDRRWRDPIAPPTS